MGAFDIEVLRQVAAKGVYNGITMRWNDFWSVGFHVLRL